MTVTAAGRAFLRAASHACNIVNGTAGLLPDQLHAGSRPPCVRAAVPGQHRRCLYVPTPSASEPVYHLGALLLLAAAAAGWAGLRNTTAAEATWRPDPETWQPLAGIDGPVPFPFRRVPPPAAQPGDAAPCTSAIAGPITAGWSSGVTCLAPGIRRRSLATSVPTRTRPRCDAFLSHRQS